MCLSTAFAPRFSGVVNWEWVVDWSGSIAGTLNCK
jgi:hypothetical protein